ncbi:MAG: hypothetical protein U0572_05700 [Phycisphaerales bacterium]
MPRRALIQTVGLGDTVWEALAYAIKTLKPDRVEFVCTAASKAKNLERLLECPEFGFLRDTLRAGTHVVSDGESFPRLFDEMLEIISRMETEYAIEVDITTGTKPMSAALAAAAVARRVDKVHYATGPRDSRGVVTTTTEVLTVRTGSATAELELQELAVLFNQHRYASVAALAASLAKRLLQADPVGRAELLLARAESIERIALAYDLWDRFEWNRANGDALKGVVGERLAAKTEMAGWPIDRLRAQRDHVRRCAQPLGLEQAVDLFVNAKRAFEVGRFDDSTARLYRLAEYLGQLQFRGQFPNQPADNPTRSVPSKALADRAPRWWQERDRSRSNRAPETVTLGLDETLRVLREVDDPLGRWAGEHYFGDGCSQGTPAAIDRRSAPRGDVWQLLQERNNSFLAHGTSPAKAESTGKLLHALDGALEVVAKSLGRHDELRALEERSEFVRCPWDPIPVAGLVRTRNSNG